MNKEEILKALEVIKKVCSEVEKCNKCPLSNVKTDMCYMKDLMPEEWRIKSNKDERWKAFYD